MKRKKSMVECKVTLGNEPQRQYLCKRIRELGAEPTVVGETVTVTARYPSHQAEMLIELTEGYWRHEICVLNEK